MTEMPTVTVGHRFRGPARSGNGGYTAGLLAERLLDATGRLDQLASLSGCACTPHPRWTVALEIDVDAGAGTATMRDGAVDGGHRVRRRIRAGRCPPVPDEASRRAPDRTPGQTDHPFPGCFVCGTDRAEGDGMRIFPGALGQGRTACTWTPDASVGRQSVDAAPCGATGDRVGRAGLPGRVVVGPRWSADGARDDDRRDHPSSAGGRAVRDHRTARHRGRASELDVDRALRIGDGDAAGPGRGDLGAGRP